MDLASIWLLLIGFFLLYYAITDGADLGVGILSLIAKDRKEQEQMMSTVSSIWHGNQTWLVILGGMLFGAFPLFYSLVLSALYIPFIIMLFGLVFRGVAFEFHEIAHRKGIWIFSFGAGSLIVTLAQGFALGGLLGGLNINNGEFVGGVWDWLTPYSLLAATGVLFGYLMLGANFLIARTEGELQKRSFRNAVNFGILTCIVSIGVHAWTTIRHSDMAKKWALFPQSPMAILTVLTGIAFVMYFLSLKKKKELAPYIWNGILIILSFTGLSIGLYPHMIPGALSPGMDVHEVAASPKTLKFMLTTTAIILPVIFVYTSYGYWVFRHKSKKEDYSIEKM